MNTESKATEAKTNRSGHEKRPEKPKKVHRNRLRKLGPLFVSDKDKRADYHYRWVNDSKSRIDILRDVGYEFVLKDDGSKFVRTVNGADGLKAYLMCVPKDIHEEIQSEREEEILEYEKAMGHQGGLTNDGELNQKVYK